jgi:hypothetical protein
LPALSAPKAIFMPSPRPQPRLFPGVSRRPAMPQQNKRVAASLDKSISK